MAFPMALAAAGLQALGGMAQGQANQRTQWMQNHMNLNFQAKEAEKAYQRQVEFWHLQNQYNSPAEQMKRFGAAGLNPHLIYGQGNAGNASGGLPQYHPPSVQMKLAAPQMGAALQSVLPTLMQVGSWMQNMRSGEIEIAKNEEMVRFLTQKNPLEIARLDNALSVFPYQKSMMEAKEKTAWSQWNALLHETQHKYGVDGQSGIRAIERAKAVADLRLKNLAGDYYEPAMIMKLVGAGVGALAAGAGLGRILSTSGKVGQAARKAPKRVKTYYQDGKRRSQVVDYD